MIARKLPTIALGTALALSLPCHGATVGNLLAFYEFEGDANDSSGNGVNASLQTNAIISSVGGGFDGAGQSLDLGTLNNGGHAITGQGSHFDSAFTNNSMSVSFWQFNTGAATPSGFGASSAFWFVSPTVAGDGRGFQAHTPWSDGNIYFDQSGCCGQPAQRLVVGPGENMVSANVWQHFVFQRDSAGLMQIWVDGNLVSNHAGGAEALEAFNGQVFIGAGGGGANSFAGRIDDFAVWDTALDPDEVAFLAAGGSALRIPEPSSALLSLLGVALLGMRRRK